MQSPQPLQTPSSNQAMKLEVAAMLGLLASFKLPRMPQWHVQQLQMNSISSPMLLVQ